MEAELKRDNGFEKARESKALHVDMETLDTGFLKQKNDIQRMWERATQGLADLGNIPGVLANTERAEKAVEIVRGM